MTPRKAIFVTGGASGIGRAIALRFGRAGWFVGLGDLDEAGMAATEEMLPGGFSFSHRFDVRDRAAWDRALDGFATAAGGRIDVLANNAGVPLGGALVDNTPEEIERCLDINLKGVLFGAQAAYPWLKAARPVPACSTPPAPRASTARPAPASIRQPSSGCGRSPRASMPNGRKTGSRSAR